LLRWVPGVAVGAGGASTVGVNKLPPVGLICFSVGAGAGAAGALVVAGADVVAVVVGVVVLDGASFLPVPQPAVSAPNAMSAAPLETTTVRRTERREYMVIPIYTSRFGDPSHLRARST
jgi:hypothetical protein